LNRGSLNQRPDIQKLFSRLRDSGVILRNGIDRRSDTRDAKVIRIDGRVVWLQGWSAGRSSGRSVYFNFDLDGTRYFFATSGVAVDATVVSDATGNAIDLPSVVFVAERRDLYRRASSPGRAESSAVEVRVGSGEVVVGRLVDRSLYGVGIEIPAEALARVGANVSVRFVGQDNEVVESPAHVQYRRTGNERKGWVRIGLHLGTIPGSTMEVDRRTEILKGAGVGAWRSRADLLRASLRVLPNKAMRKIGLSGATRATVPIVEYLNESHQLICGILESVGDRRNATAVIISPAWGRTKETLQP
jgi:hypothetical protein